MINVISPWPPQRNGIADYTFELARHAVVRQTVITQAMNPRVCGLDVRILNDLDRSVNAALDSAPNLYHFGNNADHVFMVPLFLAHPGPVVIHDTTLHYLVELIDNLIPGFFSAQLASELPLLARDFEALWRKSGQKRGIEHREIKLLGWLNEAPLIIVHSNFAAQVISSYFLGKPIHVLPHFAYQPTCSHDRLIARKDEFKRRWTIGSECVLFSTVGFVTANKQYREIFKAIARLPRDLRRRVRFIIGGEVRAYEYDIRTVIEQMEVEENVVATGFLTETEMESLLFASDLVFNLRYPTYGESSGSVARALGLGCALAVTDGGSYGELPSDIAFKIPAKVDPTDDIAALIREVMNAPERLVVRKEAARAYARAHLDPARLAARYADILLREATVR